MNKNVVFIDSDELEVTLITLLIRVDSVIRILGSIEEFQRISERTIGSNGKLILLREMSIPASELEAMLVKKFIPLGFEPEKDFVFLSEQLTQGVLGREADYESPFNKPIPGSENISWLETIILEHGQFAKFLKDEIQSA